MQGRPGEATWRRGRRFVGATAGFSLLYAVAVFAGRETHVGTGELAMAWPAAGVALVWFRTLTSTTQRITAVVAITVVSGVLNQASGLDAWGSWLFGPVNASQGWVGVIVLRQLGWVRPRPLTRAIDAGHLAVAAAAGSVVSALTGGVVAWARFGADLGNGMLLIGFRNTLSAFVVSAALLAVPRLARLRGEPLARMLLVCTAALSLSYLIIQLPWPASFALIPPLLAVALRCGPDCTMVVVACQGIFVVTATTFGEGPYAIVDSLAIRVILAQGLVLVLSMVGTLITLVEQERTAALAASRRDRDTLRLHMEAALVPSAHLIVDERNEVRVTAVNTALEQLTHRASLSLLGTDPTTWMAGVDATVLATGINELVEGSSGWRGQVRLDIEYGGAWLDVALATVDHQRFPDGRRAVQIKFQLIDITSQRIAEQELERAALHDELTGLANRALWWDRLEDALTRTRRDGDLLCVLFVDIDHFKQINDTYGHAAGDDVLREVARRIDGLVRAGDTVARLGGDEFVVLCPGISDNYEGTTLAAKIQHALRPPVTTPERPITVTTSIGVAFAEGDDEDARVLLRRADTALHAAKNRGRSRFEIYAPDIDAGAERAARLLVDLERGHRAGELTNFYQPIVDAQTERVAALEALLRWNHPQRGWVTPGDFIDVLEGSDLVHRVGADVLRRACGHGAALADRGRPVYMHVNVSAPELTRPGFVDTVRSTLADTGLPPDLLVLEITETRLVNVTDTLLRDLNALRDLGVLLAVDDFGTGFSTLSHLVDLPINTVKLDQSFVSAIASQPSARSVSSGVRAMASGLGIYAVAEGVETPEQAAILRDLGYQWLQGYLYGRPQPFENLDLFDDIDDTASARA